MDKKTLKEEYRQSKVTGGIYRVTNTRNGMYLLNSTPNIKAKQNAFEFMVSTGTCFDNRIKEDWQVFGGGVFSFEVLETLEKKKDQTREQFIADLETSVQMWEEKLDSTKKY